MTPQVLVTVCIVGSVIGGAIAGTATAWWLRAEPAPVQSAAVRSNKPADVAPRAPAFDVGDFESRVTELEDRLEAYQSQLRARKNLEKYAQAVAADAKEEANAKPSMATVVDAEDPAFELAVRSVLDQVDWEKEEERKANRQQRRNERARRQVEMYTERLQLSPDQQQALAVALTQQMDQFRALSDDEEGQGPMLTRAERRERGAQIRAQTEQRLAEVLTPEQLAGYRAVTEEQFQGRRERNEPAPAASNQ